MVLYIRPSISHSCGTMGAKSSNSVLTDFSKIAHTALGGSKGAHEREKKMYYNNQI